MQFHLNYGTNNETKFVSNYTHTHTYIQESEIIASHRPIMQLNTLHTHSNLKGKTVPTEISLNKW